MTIINNKRLNIVYLIQGRASELSGVQKIFRGKAAKMLTWDEPVESAIFFPESTWSEGRQHLFESIRFEPYEYVAFVDGDISIIDGSLNNFEKKIQRLQPAVIVPLFDKNIHLYRLLRKIFRHGLAYELDEQFQVFRRDILSDCFRDRPYVSYFDSKSWWYSCVISQAAIAKLLWRGTVVDLELVVSNLSHAEYQNDFSNEFISAFLSRFGLGLYLPLSSNQKQYSSAFLIRISAKMLDAVLRSARVILFPFLYWSDGILRNKQSLLKKVRAVFERFEPS